MYAEQHHDQGVLPFRLTSFIGREAEVIALLAAERMVTVAGSGRAGKTRLAAAEATIERTSLNVLRGISVVQAGRKPRVASR